MLAQRRVPASQYFALWRGIGLASGDPSIGLRLATAADPDLSEPLVHAFVACVDLARALDVLVTYKRMVSVAEVRVGWSTRSRCGSGGASARRSTGGR